MKHLLWTLALFPLLANADYQFEANAAAANINVDFEDEFTNSSDEESTVTYYDLRYYFKSVSTDVHSLQLADFYSRSSWIALSRSNTITDFIVKSAGESFRSERVRDIDRAVLSGQIFTSPSLYFELHAGIEQDNSVIFVLDGPTPEPEDEHLYGFGAGYYINETATIGARYELQDTEFGSLSAYQRQAEIYQRSVLTLNNGTKLFTESTLSFERSEDKEGSSESARDERGVDIHINWLINKQFALGASWNTEWNDDGKLHTLSAEFSYALNENIFLEAAYLLSQSNYRAEEEVSGDGLGLNLRARF